MRLQTTRRPLLLALTLAVLPVFSLAAQPAEPTLVPQIRDVTGTPFVERVRPDLDRVRAALAAEPGKLGLAGTPVSEVHRNYVYVQDTDGTLPLPFRSEQDVQAALEFSLQQLYRVLPDEFLFVYMFTSFPTNIGAYFYAPFQNDDMGIGQSRFDRSGPSPLEGIVFMNYYRDFEQQFGQFGRQVVDGFSRSVFNQEAGHRWGTIFEFGPGVGDGRLPPLLGRDSAHWSYFAHTGGSPMEGNSWRDNGDGTFTTRTSILTYDYCDVDLYLMGLIPPADVGPLFLISNPQVIGDAIDIFGQRIGPSSPPQVFDPKTVRGTRVNYTIDDFLQRLGSRRPAAGEAPTRWRSAFVMLAGRDSGLGEADKAVFEGMVDGYIAAFHAGTRNLGTLDAILDATPPKQPIGGPCQDPSQCNATEATLCSTPPGAAAAFCTRSCSSPASCPAGWCCLGDGQGTDVCQPAELCQPAPAPDAGSTGDDAGAQVCTCDLTFACDEACACDQECPPIDAGSTQGDAGAQICTCDLTNACDEGCACDQNCLPIRKASGCGCSTAPSGAPPDASAVWALAIAGFALVRRRRS